MKTLRKNLNILANRPEIECKKPSTIAEFEQYRPEICNFVKELLSTPGHKIISAPAKSGKLEMMLYAALRYYSPTSNSQKRTIAIFVSSFYRKDIKLQAQRLQSQRVETFFVSRHADKLKKLLIELSANPYVGNIVIFMDESDYGTGNNQCFSKTEIFNETINNPKVYFWLFSATNEEVAYSDFAAKASIHTFHPPSSYRGAEWYLSQFHSDGTPLVEEATPFCINGDTTEQGEIALNYLLQSETKNIGVIRIAYNKEYSKCSPGGSQHEKFMHDKINRGFKVKWIDYKNSHEWDSETNNELYLDSRHKWLFVINQTCCRSAEVTLHRGIAFWHDYRPIAFTQYNTIHQAIARTFHYDTNGHKIKLFTSIRAMEGAAGRITMNDVAVDMSLSSRITTIGLQDNYEYFRYQLKSINVKSLKKMSRQDANKKIMAEMSFNSDFDAFTNGFVFAYASRREENVLAWGLGDLQPQSTHQTKGKFQVIVMDDKSNKCNGSLASWEKAKQNGMAGKLIAICSRKKPIVAAKLTIKSRSDYKHGTMFSRLERV